MAAEYGPYNATLVRVIDGDTVVLNVSLGFNVRVEQHIRVFGLDSPELFSSDPVERERGRAAKAFVESIFAVGAPCVIRTDKDKQTFGRFVASVLLANGRDLASDVVAAGHGSWSHY